MAPKNEIKNIAASVKERLLNISRNEQKDYQAVFKQFIQERMLYRLSASQYSKSFILKGALLFLSYDISRLRPTKDIDLMGQNVSNDLETIRDIFKEIAQIKSNDGLVFESSSILTGRIVEDGKYNGIRIKLNVKLGNARDRLQIDIGFGDKIYKGPVEMSYPVLLDMPAPNILAYSIETAIAEKFEAIVSLGLLTSRMKDFFDILFFAQTNLFNSKALSEAILLTFENRQTDITLRERIYSAEFRNDKDKQTQWLAFLAKNKLDAEEEFTFIVAKLERFFEPLFELKGTKIWNPEKWNWE